MSTARSWRQQAVAAAAPLLLLLLLGALLLAAGVVTAVAQTPRAGDSAVHALSIDEALRLAESQSEAVQIAQAGVERARGQQLQTRSLYLPQLTGSLTYQRLLQSQFQAIVKQSGSGGDGGDAADNPLARVFASENTLIGGVQLSQNLFSGGRILAQNRAAGAGRSAADVALASSRAQVALDVAQAYYDAALSERMVAIAESSLVQTERTLRQVRLARQVGNQSEFELLRAQVARDNLRPTVIQARTQRDVAHLRLRQLLNLPLDQPLSLTSDLGDTTVLSPAALRSAATDAGDASNVRRVSLAVSASEVLEPDPGITEAVARVVATADTSAAARAPVRQAQANVDVQQAQFRAARAQRLPGIQLSSTYQRYAYPINGVPTALNQFYPNWTVAVGLSVPLFTGGRIRGEEMVARANVVEARQQLQQVQELASLDARLATAQLEEAEAAWASSAGTAQQASRAYTIAEVRYTEGISTQIELNESRNLLQQAAANRAQAARDLQVARLRLSLLRDLPLQVSGAGAAAQQQSQAQRQQQQQAQQQQQQQQQRQQQSQAQGGGAAGAGAPAGQ
ncbi:MAG TPA: TolC family protein [Gemmatimonadaceae bacterium]|nr:TolC family protein [Gemmatimonadaceae bacterium]